MAIPFVNVVAYFVILIIGVGGAFSTLFNGYRKPHYAISDVSIKEKHSKK